MKYSCIKSMGPNRWSKSPRAPTVLILSRFSRFCDFGKYLPPYFGLSIVEFPKYSCVRSMGPDRWSRSPRAQTVPILSRFSRPHVSRFHDFGKQLPPCSGLLIVEFLKSSRVRSMGPDRQFRSPRAPMVQILSRFSQLSDFGKQHPPCS